MKVYVVECLGLDGETWVPSAKARLHLKEWEADEQLRLLSREQHIEYRKATYLRVEPAPRKKARSGKRHHG